MSIRFLFFLIGLGIASAVFLVLIVRRRQIGAGADWMRGGWQTLREALATTVEHRHRDDILWQASISHLAAQLFPLERILIEPHFMAPPQPIIPGQASEPGRSPLFPYMPEWPGLSAAYRQPTLSLGEVLKGNPNLLVTGAPGMGKSVCLAAIARLAAAAEPPFDPYDRVPFLIHAGDLAHLDRYEREAATTDGAKDLPRGNGKLRFNQYDKSAVVEVLIAAVQHRASGITSPRLPPFVRAALRAGRALILLDGLDELPRAQLAAVATWLEGLLQSHPRTQVIAAGPSSGFGPLVRLGLVPVSLAQWGEEDCRNFLARWGGAWRSTSQDSRVRSARSAPDAGPAISRVAPDPLDPAILNGWLTTWSAGRTPLDVTLRAWAAYADDLQGSRPIHAIEAFIHRSFPHPVALRALETLAYEQITQERCGIAAAEALALVKPVLAESGWTAEAGDLILGLADRQLLLSRSAKRYSLPHPSIAGALAAASLARNGLQAPDWNGASHALQELALTCYTSLADAGPQVAGRLDRSDELLHRDLLKAAGWLRDAYPNSSWRSEVLRRLAELFMAPELPSGLRARLLGAFLAFGEADAAQLFRLALNSRDHVTRRYAALGLGARRESSSEMLLKEKMADPAQDVRRAACLALASFGTKSSLDAVAESLLDGDQDLREAAAEGLAIQGDAGHSILREALADEEIAVRRAAVLGLGHVQDGWARAALEGVIANDDQWIVRSQAEEVLQKCGNRLDRALGPTLPPSELGWLVAFAARHGSGLPPGPPAIRVLIRASDEGTLEERLAALQALGHLGSDSVVGDLYRALQDPEPEVRDMAFEALAYIGAATGERLPSPDKSYLSL